ncbi:hypothetical protein FXO38_16257 [Capsicum annuum]|uniref:Uncharacterized protein n=1 Tax=Capsicum annuum TaxID=4072 RepID=A0A2G3AP85_CAPAN|nr:hypothetical protein FXO38_16257 [Capsicum annuum]PHT96045.1 hypothetical protein T459_03927 [Capsicum annuum]
MEKKKRWPPVSNEQIKLEVRFLNCYLLNPRSVSMILSIMSVAISQKLDKLDHISSQSINPASYLYKEALRDMSNNKFTGDVTAPVPALKLPICAKHYTVEESQLSPINLLLLAEIRFFCVHTKDLPDGQILAVKNVKTLAFSITDEEEQFLEVIRTASHSKHVPIAGHLAVHGNEYLRKVVTFDDALHNVSCMPLNWSRIAGALKNPSQDVLSGSLADLFVGFDKHIEMDLSNNKFNGDLTAALVPALKIAICAKLQLQFSPINLLVVEIRQILAVKNIKTLALSTTDEAEQLMEVIRTASLALHGNHHLRNAVTFDDALHNVSCLLLQIAGALKCKKEEEQEEKQESEEDGNAADHGGEKDEEGDGDIKKKGRTREMIKKMRRTREMMKKGRTREMMIKMMRRTTEVNAGDGQQEQPQQIEAGDGQQEQPEQVEVDIDDGDAQQEQPQQIEDEINAGDTQQQQPPAIEDGINAGDAQQPPPPLPIQEVPLRERIRKIILIIICVAALVYLVGDFINYFLRLYTDKAVNFPS